MRSFFISANATCKNNHLIFYIIFIHFFYLYVFTDSILCQFFIQVALGLWGPILDDKELLTGQNVIIRNLAVKTWRGSKQISVLYDTTLTILKDEEKE